MTTLRDTSDAISPSWWNGPNGSRVRYAMSTPFDALLDSFTFACFAQLPSTCPADAFPWIGTDRQIVQGYQESQTNYASRLAQWLDRWPTAGKPTGVMLSIIGWIFPQIPKMLVVSNSSIWQTYATGVDPMPPGATTVAPPAYFKGTNWNWDGNTVAWARSWLVIFSVAPSPVWITALGTWGSGLKWGDPTICWGFSAPALIPLGISALVKQWRAAHCPYPWIIVSFNASEWDQTHAAGGGVNPDGTFGSWKKFVGGAWVSSRFSDSRYISGG